MLSLLSLNEDVLLYIMEFVARGRYLRSVWTVSKGRDAPNLRQDEGTASLGILHYRLVCRSFSELCLKSLVELRFNHERDRDEDGDALSDDSGSLYSDETRQRRYPLMPIPAVRSLIAHPLQLRIMKGLQLRRSPTGWGERSQELWHMLSMCRLTKLHVNIPDEADIDAYDYDPQLLEQSEMLYDNSEGVKQLFTDIIADALATSSRFETIEEIRIVNTNFSYYLEASDMRVVMTELFAAHEEDMRAFVSSHFPQLTALSINEYTLFPQFVMPPQPEHNEWA